MTDCHEAGRHLVVGLGVTGRALVGQMIAEGLAPLVVDDAPSDEAVALARTAGVDLVVAPDRQELERLASVAVEIVVSPGVPAAHPVFSLSASVPIVSEIEWASRRARAPIVAVTGTSGKTTVTTLVARMLARSGRDAVACGNIGLSFTEALGREPDVFVVEVSSFQLSLADRFHPAVATWLNLAENHQDWHPSFEHYAQAKARLFAALDPADTAVVNADDERVMTMTASTRARIRTFSVLARTADDHVAGDHLVLGDSGARVAIAQLDRRAPHDLANALAAAGSALATGADPDACRAALLDFRGLPHRIELIGEAGGVRYVDDSKATTPQAVLAACAAFPSIVLIAGGRNKGIALDQLSSARDRLRHVVAIGEAAGEIEEALAGVCTVSTAASMDEAVDAASSAARPGDTVLLSPACASFDWYSSYAQRGEDFARIVRARLGLAGGEEGAR